MPDGTIQTPEQAVDTPVQAKTAEQLDTQELMETEPATATATEKTATAEQTAEPVQTEEPDRSRTEFKQMFDSFGAEIASEVFASGGSFADAQNAYIEKLKRENETLKQQLKTSGGATPATASPEPKERPKLFKTI